MPPSAEHVAEEQRHLQNVINTFQQYGPYALASNNRRRKDLYSLPLDDQELLEGLGYKDKLIDIDRAIMANEFFIQQIVAHPEIFAEEDDEEDDEMNGAESRTEAAEQARPSHSRSSTHRGGDHSHSHTHAHERADISNPHSHETPKKRRYRPTDFDMDKLRSTLKQFVRDWSLEGKIERDACYEPLKEALLQHFASVPEQERHKLRVLVPGTGLGRLAYDIARLGFSCQGNEFSHYMLLASFFILNRTKHIGEHSIYPYVHSLSNIPDRDALLREVKIPDVLPSDIPREAHFSLVAGDFEEVYGAPDLDESDEPQAGKWDSIVTCFFIDTAKNVINYLRIIHKILSPGGVWINLGPLLWHWENNTTNDLSIELDLNELKALCCKLGFVLSNERTIETTYTNNTESMLGYVYRTSFWTATKLEDEQAPSQPTTKTVHSTQNS